MTHETPLSGLAEVATDQLAEIHRLREINAELLATLEKVKQRCLFADDYGGIGVTEDPCIEQWLFQEILDAITRAEAGK